MKTHPIETFVVIWVISMFVGANIDMSTHTPAGALVILVAMVLPFVLNSCELISWLSNITRGNRGDGDLIMKQIARHMLIRSITLVVVLISTIMVVPNVAGIEEANITRDWFIPVLQMAGVATATYWVVVKTAGWITGRFCH